MTSDSGRDVVMVHGIMTTGGVFFRMKNYLERQGMRCHVIQLKPYWGGAKLEDLATQLQKFIDDNVQDGGDLSLVGYSMGALVCRYYLQELGGYKKAKRFFSISGPHHGTIFAYTWIGKGTAQMRLGSTFLDNLNKKQDILKNMTLVSYRTRFENVIIPSKSSHWDIAENVICPVISHQWMVLSKRVSKNICSRIKKDKSIEI